MYKPEIKLPEDDPNHWAIGRYWKGHGGFYWCESYESLRGFWLVKVDESGERQGDERTNVSTRALGRTFHRPHSRHPLHARTSPTDPTPHPYFSYPSAQEPESGV